jgi:HlyD family secretion protein
MVTQKQLASLQPDGSDFALAQSAGLQATAAADAARARLRYSTITAPKTGTLIVRNVEVGDGVQAGKVLLVISPQGTIQLVVQIDEKNMKAEITHVITGSSQSVSSCCGTARQIKDGAWLVNWGGKLDQQRGTFANGVSSTVLPNGVATRILVRPTNVFSYRVIPYYLTNGQIGTFRNDLINR